MSLPGQTHSIRALKPAIVRFSSKELIRHYTSRFAAFSPYTTLPTIPFSAPRSSVRSVVSLSAEKEPLFYTVGVEDILEKDELSAFFYSRLIMDQLLLLTYQAITTIRFKHIKN